MNLIAPGFDDVGGAADKVQPAQHIDPAEIAGRMIAVGRKGVKAPLVDVARKHVARAQMHLADLPGTAAAAVVAPHLYLDAGPGPADAGALSDDFLAVVAVAGIGRQHGDGVHHLGLAVGHAYDGSENRARFLIKRRRQDGSAAEDEPHPRKYPALEGAHEL